MDIERVIDEIEQIVLSGSAWTILREKDGVYADGVEKYESPEAALTSMNVAN
jgi:hypothetical protein